MIVTVGSGPPRTVTNLRPVKFAVAEDETELEARLREARQEAQTWNQQWWHSHNTNFTQARQAFVKVHRRNNLYI